MNQTEAVTRAKESAETLVSDLREAIKGENFLLSHMVTSLVKQTADVWFELKQIENLIREENSKL